MVQKKKLNKISDYVMIISIGVPLSVLNFSCKLYVPKYVRDIIPHNIPYFDKSNMAAGENVLDIDVSDIMSNMLETELQIHKENYDVTHENNHVSK